jgi:hypothetical protein
VMALIGNLLAGTLRMGRQMHAERDRRQCELLLAAAIERAAEAIAADQAYSGEMIDLPAAEILGLGDGRVSIEVERPEAAAPRLRIAAEYPLGSEQSVRRSRTIQLTTNPPKE